MPAHPPGMTITTRTEQSRQPAGVPIGGQYATTARHEPDVQLDPARTSHADTAIDELTATELLAAARQSVRTHAFNKGVWFEGEDDMVQATVEAVLQYKHRNGQVVITRPYVHTVGAGIVAHAARGRLRAEDRKAIGIFNAKVSEMELELGRRLTSAEQDQVAAKIRADWHDPRHRPSVDFVALAQVRVLSLDAPAGSGEETDRTLADTLTEIGTLSTDFELDDRAVDPETMAGQVLSGQRGDKRANRRDAWTILASLNGLPSTQPGSIPPGRATAARAHVADAGGVCAAARTWLKGERSPATEALFGPFGDLDESGRDDVAQALLGQPAYAEELWASAMSSASKRRPR